MPEALECLVRQGYRDIVILDERHWWEEERGREYEHVETHAVARDPSGIPHRLRYSLPVGLVRERLDKEGALSESEFRNLLPHFPVGDTVEYRSSLDARDRKHAEEAEAAQASAEAEYARAEAAWRRPEATPYRLSAENASAQLEQLTPTCRACGARMDLRPSRSGQVPELWRCSQFRTADCRETLLIDREEWAKIEPLLEQFAEALRRFEELPETESIPFSSP